MWLEETTSPVDLDEPLDPRGERVLALEQLDVALRPVAEAEVLPHRDLDRAELPDEHVVDELLRRLGGEGAVERDHDELLTPSAAIRSALTASGVSSFGAASGATTAGGCGSKVRTRVRAADDLPVAEVHAVELADGDVGAARGARRGAG